MKMVDKFWFFLMAAGIVFAAICGNMESVNDALFAAAGDVPGLILGLMGMICLWTGLMKIAEHCGLVQAVSRIFAPFIRLLFPSLPKNDPAFFPIMMNFSANILGIGNAATPFGIKAMERLQQLNDKKDTASRSMITFLVLNTTFLTLMPSTMIAMRSAAGAADPGMILLPTVIASGCSLLFGLLLDRIMAHISGRRRA